MQDSLSASASDSVSITIQAPDTDTGTGTTLLSEDASSGAMVQSSNAYGGSIYSSAPERPGTFARYDGGNNWSDYQLQLDLKASDDDGIGVMFRIQDNSNYYRFDMDSQKGYRRLVKMINGNATVLHEQSSGYTQNQTYQLQVTVQGNQIQVHLDGQLWYSGSDSTYSSGTFALYCWGNEGATFDNISVMAVE